jgi:glutaminyl-tRNA synthetase
MSKRYLRYLVEAKLVDGWDDPAYADIMRPSQEGFTPQSIFEFVKRAGVSKTLSLVDIGLLEYCIRDELNKTAERRMAVTEPIKVIIDNYPEGITEYITVPNNPRTKAPEPAKSRSHASCI